jgi:hypothetical protein
MHRCSRGVIHLGTEHTLLGIVGKEGGTAAVSGHLTARPKEREG